MAAEQPATALVDGEVTLVYKLRATNTEQEDNGPLASHARRVLNVEVLVDAVNERRADVFFYDELADAASRLNIERGARLWLEASPAWLRPAEEHPRMAADPLHERRRAGSVALAPRDLLMAAQTPDALRTWRCCVHRNDNWDEVDQPPTKKKKREAIPAYVTYPSSDRVDKDHLTLRGCRAHCGIGMEVNVLGAVYATKPLQRGRTSSFITLELCDADGVYTATLTAFHETSERLPACRAGDALRCRRVVFEPPLDGDKDTHLRLRGVGWSGFARFAWPARPGFEQPLRDVAVAVDYCGAKKPTPASDALTRYAARLRGATPRAVEDDEAAGPCCLIDALQPVWKSTSASGAPRYRAGVASMAWRATRRTRRKILISTQVAAPRRRALLLSVRRPSGAARRRRRPRRARGAARRRHGRGRRARAALGQSRTVRGRRRGAPGPGHRRRALPRPR